MPTICRCGPNQPIPSRASRRRREGQEFESARRCGVTGTALEVRSSSPGSMCRARTPRTEGIPGASECLGVLPLRGPRRARHIHRVGAEATHRSCCAEFSSAVWLNPIIHRSRGFSNFSHTQQWQLLPSLCEERVGPSTPTSLVCSFAARMVESDRCTEIGQTLSVYYVVAVAWTCRQLRQQPDCKFDCRASCQQRSSQGCFW